MAYDDSDPIVPGGTFYATSLNVLAACLRALRTGVGVAHDYIRIKDVSAPVPISNEVIVRYNNTLKRIEISVDGAAFRSLIPEAAVRVTNGAQTIPHNTPTALNFGTETHKTVAGSHSTSVNTPRLIALTAGRYDIKGNVKWSPSVTPNQRRVQIRKNGTTDYNDNIRDPSSGIIFSQDVTDTLNLAVNDYVELMAFQDVGGDLDTVSASFSLTQVQ